MPDTRDLPLYRVSWTALTSEQINAELEPAAQRGPKSASRHSRVLAGRSLRVVTDGGPTLEYEFTGPRRLTVRQDGGEQIQAGYGALTLDQIVLFTHLVPDTQRGYVVVIDRASDLATVVELWFSGYKDNREVQRQLYYGYLEQPDRPAPADRHATTNRLEGKAYRWRQDNGIETEEFYPSVVYSHFVELTRPGGPLGYCAPSDYVILNENQFVYTRTECEFSGIFTMYVLDANRLEQIGLRLGFDRDDDLEYYVFRGNGQWLGQIAHFEPLDDNGGAQPPVGEGGAAPPKGARRVYRPFETMPKMTEEEVDAVVAANTIVFPDDPSPMAGNSIPATDWLVGKRFTLRYDDGPAMQYQVVDSTTLRWRREGGDWIEARYRAWESMPGVILFGHLLADAPEHDCHSIVADFQAGLVTCFNGYLNTPYIANEAGVRIYFGAIEMRGVPSPGRRRHQFTDELVGRALTWNYSPGLTSMHLYSNPHTVSWMVFGQNDAGGLEWSGPGAFVKIRDELYFAYWLEQACNGTLGTILINLRTMHDAGIDYHCGAENLTLGQVGAVGRHAGRFALTSEHQGKR